MDKPDDPQVLLIDLDEDEYQPLDSHAPLLSVPESSGRRLRPRHLGTASVRPLPEAGL